MATYTKGNLLYKATCTQLGFKQVLLENGFVFLVALGELKQIEKATKSTRTKGNTKPFSNAIYPKAN